MKISKTLVLAIGLLIAFQSSKAQAPTVDWAKSFGGTNPAFVFGTSIANDAAGNVYTTGQLSATADFNPGAGTNNLISAGSTDIFISKLDANGNFAWANRIGSTGADGATSIVADPSGNLYLTGFFSGTVDFDPAVAATTSLTSIGLTDIFILKLNSSGIFQWARQIGGTGNDAGNGITIDPTGNVLLTGSYTGMVDFDPSGITVNLTSNGGLDIFIMKFDNAGNFIWASGVGGTGIDFGNSIKTDAAGNPFTTGRFINTVDFDPGTGTTSLTSAFASTFVLKLNSSDGSFGWARNFSGGFNEGNSIAIDNSGNVLTTGLFVGTVDFDPDAGVFTQTEVGSDDFFISKLDASGNFVWAHGFGGIQEENGKGIAVDGLGNVYITGHFAATVDFDPGVGVMNLSSTPSNTYDIYILKLDASGNFAWVGQMGGANDFEIGEAITVDGSGNIYTTGEFFGTADFDPNAGTLNLTGAGTGENVFIQKLKPSIPTITSFTPLSGPIGTTVTITGTNFSGMSANNIVYFGATQATVTAATPTQLTVTAPAGATYQPITVLVNGLTGYSSKPFVVTFADGGIIDLCSFAPKVDFPTGSNAYSVSIGDLDGDGKADMAVVNENSNTVSVFRNTSNGVGSISYAAKIDFTTGSSPRSVSIGDLDGDGKADLAVANRTSATVSVFRNTSSGVGNISYAAKVDFTTGTSPVSVSIDDLDGDGKAELAVANSSTVSVLRNTSSGGIISYATKVDFTTGTQPLSISIGDLDGDGKADLALANYSSSSVSVLRNTSSIGNISYAAKVDFTTGTNPYSVSIGDLDGDGKADLAVASYTGGTVSVFRNTSSVGSISYAAKIDFTPGVEPVSLAISDLDGDGKADLAVANSGNNTISIFRNTSSGAGIISYAAKVDFTSGANPNSISIGDSDGDGKSDLVVANSGGTTTVSVLRNTVSSLPAFTSSSFNPTSGPVGTIVTFTGTNFSSTPLNNSIKFNGVPALVTASSATSITAIVPAGATTGPISIQIGCVTAFSIAPFTVTSGSCIPAVERTALIALYNATNGAAWTNNSNWLSADESTWYGVTLTGCNVTGIVLDNNNLINSLPPEIGDLSELIELNLSHNHLSGTLPLTLSGCTALERINLEDNQHTGTIPSYFSTFPNLNHINLGFNQFSGSITSNLGLIGPLEYLSLADNQLTGNIPTELGSLSNLKVLDLSANQLSGGIPISFGNLTLLNSLQLWSNQLTGTIPAQLGNIASLQYLNLSKNQLSGSIPNLGSTSLVVLKLSDNMITGSIPVSLSSLTGLYQLDLDQNQLTGTLPTELGLLTNLQDLNLYSNQLSGSLPIEYGSLTKLLRFRIGDNAISGSVPIEFLTWNDIEILNLTNNLLDDIPAFTAPGITELSVDYNYLDFGDLEPNISVQGFMYSPQADLPGGFANTDVGNPLTILFTASGTANQYQWFKDGVLIPGATSPTFSIASTAISDEGDYIVAITSTLVGGITLNSLPFVVTINTLLNITTQPVDITVCESNLAIFSCNASGANNINYQWQFSPSGPPAFVDIVDGPNYSGTSTASLSVNTVGNFGIGRYRCRINGDLTAEVITTDVGLFINPTPLAPITSYASSCIAASLTLTASGGTNGQYRWYNVATGGTAITGEVNSSYTTPFLTTTTTYYIAINNGTCESTRTASIATISVVPRPTITTSNCTATSAQLTGPAGFIGYSWSTGAVTQQITVSSAGSYALTVADANGCVSVLSDAVTFTSAFCNQAPVITSSNVQTTQGATEIIKLSELISDPDENLDLSTLKITQQPLSGAPATIDAQYQLIINYTRIPFSGLDELTVEVCDFSGVCVQQKISIEVIGEIVIYNGISPNGDGANDFWEIRYLDVLGDTKNNKVSLFNRWGDLVWEANNYDNKEQVFKGLNKNGNEVPSGTYFYKIEFASGRKTQIGYISLKR